MAEESFFSYDPDKWCVTQAMKDAFLNNGFILVRNMLTKEEVEKVRRVVTGSEGVMRYAFGRHDGISRKTMQCLWNHPGHDLSGALARIKRVAGTMEEAKKVLEHMYVEMKAGDMLFFHCCLLHTSDQNSSDRRRWVFISCYNKRSNNPYMEHHHPQYTPMTKLPDSALLECEETENLEGKWFMIPEEDHSVDPSKVH